MVIDDISALTHWFDVYFTIVFYLRVPSSLSLCLSLSRIRKASKERETRRRRSNTNFNVRCFIDWIPLNQQLFVGFFSTQPYTFTALECSWKRSLHRRKIFGCHSSNVLINRRQIQWSVGGISDSEPNFKLLSLFDYFLRVLYSVLAAERM